MNHVSVQTEALLAERCRQEPAPLLGFRTVQVGYPQFVRHEPE